MPDFSSAFTSASTVRGWHAQAPVGFWATGVRVPTDVGFGPVFVQICEFDNFPASFPAEENCTLVDLIFGDNSTGIIPMNMPHYFSQNAYFGIIGARYQLGSFGSSYFSSSYSVVTGTTFNSSVGGVTMEITRLIEQDAVYGVAGRTVSSELTDTIARVFLENYVCGDGEFFSTENPACLGCTNGTISGSPATGCDCNAGYFYPTTPGTCILCEGDLDGNTCGPCPSGTAFDEETQSCRSSSSRSSSSASLLELFF